ncbi:hypothetical protein MASR2M78_33330 [Treponema sp.]
MQQTSNKRPTALVTGASRGIGRGIAEELSAGGWSVIVNYCGNEAAAEESLAACHAQAITEDQRFIAIQADISKAKDRQRLVEASWDFSDGLDALVNNAGIAPRKRADILDAEEESFNEIINTNLGGPYFLTQLLARRMLSAHAGSAHAGAAKAGAAGMEAAGGAAARERRRAIVFITSISAETASINRGDYCLSKADCGHGGKALGYTPSPGRHRRL